MATEKIVTENDKIVILHYIDKNHNMVIEAGKAINGVMVFLTLATFIVIALASGIVSADQKISIIGINLAIPPWLLLVGGTGIVGGLLIYLCCLDKYQWCLSVHIRKLYKSINFKDETLEGSGFDAAYCSSIPVVIGLMHKDAHTDKPNGLEKLIYQVGLVLTIIIWFLIPLTAEGYAGYKMITLYNWAWLLFFIPLFLISIGYVIPEMLSE